MVDIGQGQRHIENKPANYTKRKRIIATTQQNTSETYERKIQSNGRAKGSFARTFEVGMSLRKTLKRNTLKTIKTKSLILFSFLFINRKLSGSFVHTAGKGCKIELVTLPGICRLLRIVGFVWLLCLTRLLRIIG